MNKNYEKLKTLLRELFQLDQPDLDFGVYRILRARSAEITQFLDQDLLPQVKEAFAQYKPADKAALEKELEKAIEQARGLGVDPETTQKVKELRARLAEEAVDIDALEAEVYDHLYRFFRRYYHEGDFISRRVYKEGVYAIPYEGEEVKLYWANHDQYYIKTSEYLRHYTFHLQPGDEQNPMRVRFELVDAAEGEHGNVKERNDLERRFRLAPEPFAAVEDGELVVRFTYAPDPEKRKQKDLNAEAEAAILSLGDAELREWIKALAAKHVRADGTHSDNTRLRVHLDRYTARNTFDYFIHKDLGGFLRRELDFYIKNEVMHLDDIESESAPRVEQYLSKIKVIRRIAHKIIDFLAQLEDFQKKLWLKKKFVTETSWCVRLGVIPEDFYPEIAANDGQREEWVRLCAIDELKPEGGDLFEHGAPGYSEPLTVAFLKSHPALMVDTRHFDADFTARLLEAIGDVDEQTDGVLFHSENFQALRFMHARFAQKIGCVYIDPPYNTEQDRQTGRFLYKDNYEHSTWLAMMENRLTLDKPLLSRSAAYFISSDESELHRLITLSECYGRLYQGLFTWRRTRTGGHLSSAFNQLSDYVVVATNPGGPYLFGGQADPEESQPLTKASNNRKELLFPPGSLEFLDFEEGTLSEGYEGTGSNAVRCRTSIQVRDGRNVNEAILEGPFVWTQEKLEEELESGAKIIVKRYRNLAPRFLRQPKGHKPFPSLADNHFPVGTNEDGSETLTALGFAGSFTYPKPVDLLERIVESKGFFDRALVVLDYFAGSGTTGHAVINLNREDGGQRKFILVEQGDYFDTVLLPRLKKVTFSPEWKDGKPRRLATAEEAERGPRIFKVVRLESYEDTLNNLELKRTEAQQSLLDLPGVQGPDRLREQYILRYMLDVESRCSQSLLNVAAFTDPTAYTLKVKRPGSEEAREVKVDLIETFNWLIGLVVEHMAAPQAFAAEFERDGEGRLRLKGRLKQEPGGPWWFRTVTGTTRYGRKTLVIWRKRPGGEEPKGIEQDNLVLDEWFQKQGYSSKDSEFDLIYVNGDNNLENLKAPDDTWKVRLIEEDFFNLMFQTKNT